jgi:hypothetical protein
MKIIDFEVLALVVVASAVVAKIFQIVKERACPWWSGLNDKQRATAGYVIILISAGLMWLTDLNMLPGFSRVWGPAGRLLTCVIGGFGPSVVYDMWMDKPTKPPAPMEDVPEM